MASLVIEANQQIWFKGTAKGGRILLYSWLVGIFILLLVFNANVRSLTAKEKPVDNLQDVLNRNQNIWIPELYQNPCMRFHSDVLCNFLNSTSSIMTYDSTQDLYITMMQDILDNGATMLAIPWVTIELVNGGPNKRYLRRSKETFPFYKVEFG